VRDKGNDKELAETAFKDILKDNEKLIDVRLSLGLLYESWNKRDQALEQYRKILEFLPGRRK
jgi:tetratricopeptide (TPR) repeat protein